MRWICSQQYNLKPASVNGRAADILNTLGEENGHPSLMADLHVKPSPNISDCSRVNSSKTRIRLFYQIKDLPKILDPWSWLETYDYNGV